MIAQRFVPTPLRSPTTGWRDRMMHPLIHAAAAASVVGALVTFIIPALRGQFAGEFEDFAGLRVAGAAVLHGANPYATFGPLAAATPVQALGFDYPPLVAWLLQPFAIASPAVADAIWLCVGLGCMVGGAVLVATTVLPARWPRVSIAIVAAFLFGPAVTNVWHGNVNFIVFLTLALGLRAWVRGRELTFAGWIAAGAAIKLAPLVLVVLMLRRGWYRGAALTVVAFLGSLGAGAALVGPASLRTFVTSVVPVLAHGSGSVVNQSWNGVVSRLATHSVFAIQPDLASVRDISLVLTVATLGVAAWTVRRSFRGPAERAGEYSVGLIAMLLVGSITWYEHYITLLVPLAAATALLSHGDLARRRRLLLAGAVGLSVVIFGVVARVVIADINLGAVSAWQHSIGGRVLLQLFSLPALSAAALMVALVVALRGPSTAAGDTHAAAPSRRPPSDLSGQLS